MDSSRRAEILEDALDALGTGSVIAAGHSLGGAVAIALAARRPGAVRGLVLLSMAKKVLFAPGAPAGAVNLGMEELRSCRPETMDKLTPPALSARLSGLIPRSRPRIIEGPATCCRSNVRTA